MQSKFTNKVIDTLALITICFAIFGVVFCPNTLMFTRVENLALILAVVLIFFREKLIIDKYLLFILLAYTILYWVSIAIVNKHPYNIWLYAIRPIKFLIFFVLFSNISINKYINFNYFIRWLFVAVALINLIEILNIYDLRLTFFDFFSHRDIQQFWDHESWRIIGTMNNPNENGVLLLSFVIYFIAVFYSEKKVVDSLLLVTCVLLLVFAQSRTAMYVTGLIFVLYLILAKLNKRIVIYSLLFFMLVIIGVYALDLNYVKDIFENNPLDIPTLKGRLADWEISINAWTQNKLFGVGYVSHTSYVYAADNEYLYSLAVSGIIGTLLYLSMIVYPLIRFWKLKKSIPYAMIPILFTPSFLLIAITNVTLYDVRIGTLYFILLAIPFNYLSEKQTNYFIVINWRGWFRKLNISR